MTSAKVVFEGGYPSKTEWVADGPSGQCLIGGGTRVKCTIGSWFVMVAVIPVNPYGVISMGLSTRGLNLVNPYI